MIDLAEHVKQQVRDAREAAERQREEPWRQKRSARQRAARARAWDRAIQQRFREAAEASDGAMTFEFDSTATAGIGGHAHHLFWLDPQPERTLVIHVNPTTEDMEWKWFFRDSYQGGGKIDPATFDLAVLDELIFALTNQEDWAEGMPPAA